MPKMSPNTHEDLLNRFDYHKPGSPEIADLHGSVRAACFNLAEFIRVSVPDSREQALAITKIEEAMMWANAGIARNQ